MRFELLGVRVRVELESEADRAKPDRRVLGDAEGAPKIEVPLSVHDRSAQGDADCGRDRLHRHARASDERFEELARNPDVAVACPSCGAAEAERLLSVFAGVGGSSRASAAPDMSRMPNFGTGGCGPGCGCHH